MAEIQVCPLRPENLSEVAAYLAALRRAEPPADASFDIAVETRNIEERMRWQLTDNPARLPDLAGGHFLRDSQGKVVGTHLAIPVRFALGVRPMLGLLGADLRADPRAARYSSGMFLAYLRTKGPDFHYATTTNRSGGAFFEQQKATAVPESDVEFLLPVRFGPILEELAERRKLGKAGARAARILGAGAGWLARARRGFSRTRPLGRGVAVFPCADWEQLSALAERHRDARALTNERSAAYLRWRYEDCPGSERNRVFLIEGGGNQGWAALQFVAVGTRRRLREARLMDVVWPREAMDAARLLRAVFHQCRDDCDMIRLKGGTIPEPVARQLGFWKRRLEAPTCWVAGRDSDGAPLALHAHFVAADSDTA